MGTQRILRRRADARTPHNSNLERQAAHARKRHAKNRHAHREVRRIGANHVIELEVLAAAARPEGEV